MHAYDANVERILALRADSYELKEKIKGGHIGERAGFIKRRKHEHRIYNLQ